MKNLYFTIAILSLNFSASAQVIDIPDPNFKSYLLTQLTADTDGDFVPDAIADTNGDSEIDQAEGLLITNIYVNSLNISTLSGIEFFTNLFHLDFDNNQVTTVDLHTLSHLKYVKCSNNLLTSIDLCGTAATSLWADSNPYLTYVSIKNNVISTYEIMRPATASTPPPLPSFMFDSNSLQTVCYDEGELPAIQFLQNVPDIELINDCASNCTASPNIISGNIKFDFNGDGCDTSDANGGFPIKVSQPGQPNLTFYSGSGSYIFYTFQDNLTLTPQLANPYYTISPPSAMTTYAGTGNAETIDFCVSPNGNFPDLSIDFAQVTNARPGFDSNYFIYYKNKGTVPLSGQVTVNFDDGRLDYVGSNPPVTAQSTGVLTWDFNTIAPFETGYIYFTLNVNSPSEMPPVNVGDLLNFSANIAPAAATDVNIANNTDTLTQIVRGSFDPNDLTVSKLATHIEPPLEYLNYTIRFQNTGNEPAEKVVITDMLDERFDVNAIEIISASHGYRSVLHSDNKLEFTFDNINLPPSVTDEPGSHGYVSFKVKPVEGSVNTGDTIENEANIYFDFNLPILTNAVSTMYSSTLGNNNFENTSSFTLYPNPVKNTVSISCSTLIESVAIYNTLGQLVQCASMTSGRTVNMDVASLKAGSYLVELISESGKTFKKFIKI